MSRPGVALWRGLAVLAAVALSTAACPATPSPAPPEDGTPSASRLAPGLSAEEVRDRMAGAMRREGHVYHRHAERRQDADIYSNAGTADHWLLADEELAREALRFRLDRKQGTDGPDPDATGANDVPEALPGLAIPAPTLTPDPDEGLLRGDKIVASGRLYDLGEAGEITAEEAAPTCPGLSAALSLLLGCRADAAPQWSVEDGRYRGQDAIVLVATYILPGSRTLLQIDSLYVDPATYLPWGLVQQSQIQYGIAVDSRVRADYTHAFIPVERFPAAAFDPQAPVEPTPRAAP